MKNACNLNALQAARYRHATNTALEMSLRDIAARFAKPPTAKAPPAAHIELPTDLPRRNAG